MQSGHCMQSDRVAARIRVVRSLRTRSKRRKRIYERNGVHVLPCCLVKLHSLERLAPLAGLPVSPVTGGPGGEELKSVPAPVFALQRGGRSTVFLICRSEVGALRVFVAEDCRLVITKSTRRRRRQNRCLPSPWITGSQEQRARYTSSAHRAGSQE